MLTRVWYLTMASPGDLRPARHPGPEVAVALVDPPDPELNRRFYAEIGGEHHWVDHLDKPASWWRERVEGRETLVASVAGEPAGYAELEPRPDGSVDVAYFGVLRAHQGRGVGGHLLTAAVRRAWASGAAQVTVNTCELDSPHAVDHYRARGFAVQHEALERRGRLA